MTPLQTYSLIAELAEGEHEDVNMVDLASDPETVQAAYDFVQMFALSAPGRYTRLAITILEYSGAF